MHTSKLDGQSRDLEQDRIEELKAVFPEAVSDGAVDFEKLKELLGSDVTEGEERYSFVWPGKRDAIKLAMSRNTGTLRPDKESSKDWDTTQNLFIEGDNLEVLRALQNSYRGQVKMIYIDPPYNTGKDFVYKDDFRDNIENYKQQTGQEGQSNPETAGRYHTNWLNMMYPRLRLAKNLLKPNGAIFISIDDNEASNLRKMCDEIFGEDNLVTQFVWKKKSGGASDVDAIAVDHEYVFCYSRTSAPLFYLDREAEVTTSYNLVDEDGRKYGLDRLDKQSLGYQEGLDFPIVGPDGRTYVVEHKDPTNKIARWRWSRDSVEERYNELVFNWPYVYTKNYEKDAFKPRSLLVDQRFGRTRTGKTETKHLFGKTGVFDWPKPTDLVRFLVAISSFDDKDTVLDFFSGSATTAHAVMRQNAVDGGNRRFIMVQLPEMTPEDSEARKAGYKTIAEIGRERSRRAGEKIKTDYAEKLAEREKPLDVGFKAFTLDSTNFREWDSDTSDITTTIAMALQTFKDGRTTEDALYEILLKYGVDIAEPVQVRMLAGVPVHSLAGNYLLVCLEKKIPLAMAEEMAKLKPSRVVFYDNGFESDEAKQNALETLQRAGVEDVRTI